MKAAFSIARIALSLVWALGLAGCSLILDEGGLDYELDVDVGLASSSSSPLMHSSRVLEGQGALDGSAPKVVLLQESGVREGDRLRFRLESLALSITCELPGGDGCDRASERDICCVGPYTGQERGLAAVLFRVGQFPDQAGRTIGHLQLVRGGQSIAEGIVPFLMLPELSLDGEATTLSAIFQPLADGEDPPMMFSAVNIQGNIAIDQGSWPASPLRLVSTTSIAFGSSDVRVNVGSGGQIATAPILSGADLGAVGFFAEELYFDWDSYSPAFHVDADAVLFRGNNVVASGDNVALSCNDNFYDSTEIGLCPAERRTRFDLWSACRDDTDTADPWCDPAQYPLELGASFHSDETLEIGPTVSIPSGQVVFAGSDNITVEVTGVGPVLLSVQTDGGIETRNVQLASIEPDQEGELVDFERVLVDLDAGINVICVRRMGVDAVLPDAPESGHCVEVAFLP